MHQAGFTLETGHEITTRVGHDPRADGGRRMVLLGPRCVMIKRRVQGMKMHLSVPVKNYVGVVIACEEGADGALYRISLAHRDPELCVTLKEARDQSASLEAWRRWARFFSMPTLVECAGGEWEIIEPQSAGARADALAQAPAFPRGGAPLSRRLRRLSRRKSLGQSSAANIFRGEREIICYE
jgi:hypothetical protein